MGQIRLDIIWKDLGKLPTSIIVGGWNRITHIEPMFMISMASLKKDQPHLLSQDLMSYHMPISMKIGNYKVVGRRTTLAMTMEWNE